MCKLFLDLLSGRVFAFNKGDDSGSGGGGGLAAVAHDDTMDGAGTQGSPLIVKGVKSKHPNNNMIELLINGAKLNIDNLNNPSGGASMDFEKLEIGTNAGSPTLKKGVGMNAAGIYAIGGSAAKKAISIDASDGVYGTGTTAGNDTAKAGNLVVLNPQTSKIDAALIPQSGSSGLAEVAHNETMDGDGTQANPLIVKGVKSKHPNNNMLDLLIKDAGLHIRNFNNPSGGASMDFEKLEIGTNAGSPTHNTGVGMNAAGIYAIGGSAAKKAISIDAPDGVYGTGTTAGNNTAKAGSIVVLNPQTNKIDAGLIPQGGGKPNFQRIETWNGSATELVGSIDVNRFDNLTALSIHPVISRYAVEINFIFAHQVWIKSIGTPNGQGIADITFGLNIAQSNVITINVSILIKG